MTRPLLTADISLDDFDNYYWLKNELAAFCRENHLSTSGSKRVLTERISSYLKTGRIPVEIHEHSTQPKPPVVMPIVFSRQSIIGPGWRCNQELRSFFEKELGRSFHFDSVMRNFIYEGVGKTLDEAIKVWEAARQNPPSRKEIDPQFEYNRHIRLYFDLQPGATLVEAIQAWNTIKATRCENKETKRDGHA